MLLSTHRYTAGAFSTETSIFMIVVTAISEEKLQLKEVLTDTSIYIPMLSEDPISFSLYYTSISYYGFLPNINSPFL